MTDRPFGLAFWSLMVGIIAGYLVAIWIIPNPSIGLLGSVIGFGICQLILEWRFRRSMNDKYR